MSNNKYYEQFKDKVTTATQLGSALGAHPHHMEVIFQDIAVDPDVPTAAKCATATECTQDKYLASVFLLNSDNKHYGSLVHDIVNEFTCNSDTYPHLLSSA
jgi:hypothetical protein